MMRIVLLPLIVLSTGCLRDVPSNPSFQEDVQPILAANCVRCHGYPAIGGAPRLMRLDSYETFVLSERDDAGQLREELASGAAALHTLVVVGVNGGDGGNVGAMPPRFALDDDQIEILERWSANATGGRAPRGAPRPDNHAPTIQVLTTSQIGGLLELTVEVDDLDRDVVAGELRVRIGASERFVGPLRSGRTTIRWDVGATAPDSYPLTAHLDDGAQVHVISVGMLVIGGS